jgi:hypothetical protein
VFYEDWLIDRTQQFCQDPFYEFIFEACYRNGALAPIGLWYFHASLREGAICTFMQSREKILKISLKAAAVFVLRYAVDSSRLRSILGVECFPQILHVNMDKQIVENPLGILCS